MRWQGFKGFKLYGLKVHIVIIVMLIALVCFWGAQRIFNGVNFEQPLKKELDGNQQIADYRIIDEESDVYTIVITLNATNNLKQTYNAINDPVQLIMGEHPFQLEFTDYRNDKLNDIYDQGQFMIYEALVNGNFRDMSNVLEENAQANEVESKVFIDQDNIYWQMKDEAHYLYTVIPRKDLSFNISEG